jgi:3' terminal RNA ribose 2'-O-methyltransferase Hen1
VLLTITTTQPPATDLGYLLHKHPDRAQAFEVSAGTAHVFFPEATDDRCTAALLLEVDPVDLVRGRRGPSAEGFELGQYVNDRPYAASSLLAVALARTFSTALAGRCNARPKLAAAQLPLEIRIPALPCRGGPELAGRMFGPLGWQVAATPVALDPVFPGWGDSSYVDLRLTGSQRLSAALNHLYVLLPVLDNAKHYWVAPDEVDKLIRAGAGWLASHPDGELITRRYLAHRAALYSSALARLAESDDAEPDLLDNATDAPAADPPDQPVPLADQRCGSVLAVLRAAGASRVADLGCGQGRLLAALLADPAFTAIIGIDVSARALQDAAKLLRLDRMPEPQRQRLRLFQSSLAYRDRRIGEVDAAVLMEVIEHVDPPRLPAVEHTVFAGLAPQTVIVTTPNAEYNPLFAGLAPGAFRHRDHRFEWTRAEFAGWARQVGERHRYAVRFLPVGAEDAGAGAPTQLAVFTRTAPGGPARPPSAVAGT